MKHQRSTILGLAIALLLIIACATSKSTYLPSGEQGHSINCSGTALTWGACYEKAGKLCGSRGYEVVAGGSEHGAVVSANSTSAFGSTIMQRTMLIKCQGSAS
jgi:hypothetical protein